MNSRILGATLLIAGVVVSGCADASLTDGDPNVAEVSMSKMRHQHLFSGSSKFVSRAKTLERYSELAASSDFVLGMYKTLERFRVLERYEDLEGVTVKRDYTNVFDGFAALVNGSGISVEEFLAIVESDPDIEWIEPDARIVANKPKEGRFKGGNTQYLPWGVDRIDADVSSIVAGDESGNVSGVDLYILDSGVKGHDVKLVSYFRNGGDDTGRDFYSDDGSDDTRDALGHGTHVAGIAAAQDNAHGVVGVAPGVNVHNLKVLDDDGRTDLSTVIAAVEYITAVKLSDPSRPIVVNISFGADVGTMEYNALDHAISESIGQGVVFVLAAGNEGIDAATVTPAHVENAITVGSYGEDNGFSWFSNFGVAVDLLAPGEDIVSSSNATGAKLAPVLMSGTSMAAPHVAGAAVLYLSQNPLASPAQVKQALAGSAKPWISGQPAGTTNLSVYAGDF